MKHALSTLAGKLRLFWFRSLSFHQRVLLLVLIIGSVTLLLSHILKPTLSPGLQHAVELVQDLIRYLMLWRVIMYLLRFVTLMWLGDD
jgi:hypothetical protein